MFYDLGGPDAEATTSADRVCEGTNEHVDAQWVDVLVLGDTTAGAAEDAKGIGFVEDEAVLKSLFKFDLKVD